MPELERGTFCPSSASNPQAPVGTKSVIRVFTSVRGENTEMRSAESRAEQYRRYAAECVRLASLTEDALEKGVLLQMAEQWQQLAARADKDAPRA